MEVFVISAFKSILSLKGKTFLIVVKKKTPQIDFLNSF